MAQKRGKSSGGAVAAEIGQATHMVRARMRAGLRTAARSPKAMLRTFLMALLALAALAFVALWLGGHLPTVAQSASDYKRDRLMALGFVVEHIDVMGEGRLNEADVRAAVGIYEGDYFFDTDLNRAQERTESLPWVDRAVVRRLWPNRIVVQLVETEPYALYQEQGEIFLASASGEIVAPLTPETSRLPETLRVFTGEDAEIHASEISAIVESVPSIWDATVSLTRFPSGRWDIRLEDGTLIKLPAEDVTQTLRRFARMDARHDILSGHEVVDLRLSDRLSLTPRGNTPALDTRA